jgi:glyoxylase-like metal-dependent hydrolase (beta-lactamase superfamily II)
LGFIEIADRTWRIESLIGPRSLFQYVLAGDGRTGEALLVDTGTSATPRDAILPALRSLGIRAESVRYLVVTHPDLDHQGGLGILKQELPTALAACGFADRGLVSEPERLVTDRYGAYEAEHGMGYSSAEKESIRRLYGSPVSIDRTFAGGEQIELGDRKLTVLHAPGHSAGHLVLYEAASGVLFSSDAVHWRFCPAADGTAALPPTYEDVEAYVATIELLESVAPNELHSGHWPARKGTQVLGFLRESREFVGALDAALQERLDAPSTLHQLCEHVEMRLGPFGADPVNLMFAVHGHLRRLVRRGDVRALDLRECPRRFELAAAAR